MNSWLPDIHTASTPHAKVEDPGSASIEVAGLSTDHSLSIEADHVSPCIPKYRSDLAFASGFAGLACLLFRFSLIPLIFRLGRSEVLPGIFFFLALPLPGLPAPLALWLGVKAWSDLMRHPNKSGWVPTTIGLVVGFLGTLILLFEIYQVAKTLFLLSLQ